MKVLITGGTGTISSGIVKECIKNGYETYAITRGNNHSREIKGAHYIIADIWQKDIIAKKIKDEYFDVIVECLVYDKEHLQISLENFSNCCRQYIFISTAGVYSRDINGRVKENDEKNSIEWEYTRTKIECEQYLKEYCTSKNLNYTIIRPIVTYGDYRIPFPVATRTPAWTFFQRIEMGKPMLACDNVKCCVIHVDDFSYAVIKLFANPKAYNEEFHIADESGEIYWDDTIKEAATNLNVAPFIIHVPVEEYKTLFAELYDELKWNKTKSKLFDNTKLKEAVPSFCQKISLSVGIKLIMEGMKKEFDNNRLDTDIKWNKKCDALILQSYSKGILLDEEQKQLKRYYMSLSKKQWKQLKHNLLIMQIKSRIKKIIY